MGNTRYDSSAQNCDAGIIPNALIDIFALIEKQQTNAYHAESWQVIVSYLEVYNEQVYDLLEPTGKPLQLREDQDRGIVVVAGIAEKIADSPTSVLELLRQGNCNRKTEATMANAVSSRSHAVLQLTVRHSKSRESGHASCIETKLSLIDLAGSERASATNNRGVRLQEGANINKSLLALANCINALAGNNNASIQGLKKSNVKYRDSKLTHLLKSSLEGRCKLVMIANINPSCLTFEDSNNTLKYANRAKNIKISASMVPEQLKDSTWIERETALRNENAYLRNKITELEDELAEIKVILTRAGIVSRGHHGSLLDDLSSRLLCDPSTDKYHHSATNTMYSTNHSENRNVREVEYGSEEEDEMLIDNSNVEEGSGVGIGMDPEISAIARLPLSPVLPVRANVQSCTLSSPASNSPSATPAAAARKSVKTTAYATDGSSKSSPKTQPRNFSQPPPPASPLQRVSSGTRRSSSYTSRSSGEGQNERPTKSNM